ncbi:hypothetical protein, partial [Acinetobacter baumannii]|uniref:hypothetical protein n=1 Tax=Acinetobacter baumannii TaxID=470 RepID=UPI001BC87595
MASNNTPSSSMSRWGKKKNGGMAGVFAAIAVVAILAAGALFFLWRNAASDADKPAPEPVTETTT